MGRLSHTQALLGPEVFELVRATPILVVGAGGIGCELLKNLVLVGFTNIEIIDLDTIDLSNLNRQFLFRKPDISKPKAIVAAATAHHFNPSSGINIHARHGNVKESANDIEWISKFGLVLNALDNVDARRHVNKLCQAADVPLIESGTAGYLGQVSPHVHNKTECFDCLPKPTPKSFPVCTIRSTPSEPIHCIVWSKSYLFPKLFGEDDEEGDEAELDKAKADGENAEEIEELKKEAAAFREVRTLLAKEDGPERVFRKVFYQDINRLLAMEDMWKKEGRVKPVALDYDGILDGTFATPPTRASATPAPASANGSANGTTSKSTLKDQKELSLKENLELFIDSSRRLSARAVANPDIILEFDKDDDDTLDFVLAVANLRATAYGIPTKTRFQVKEMAGNIIPAIATTNAIIAGLIVMQALSLLKREVSTAKTVYLKAEAARPLGMVAPAPPDPNCAVCRDIYIPLHVDVKRFTLGSFVEEVLQSWLRPALFPDDEDAEFEASVQEGGRILADPDFDDNHHKTLAELGIQRGQMLSVTDEDDKFRRINFCILEQPENAEAAFALPAEVPEVPLRPAKPVPKSPSPEPEIIEAPVDFGKAKGTKRSAPEDEGDANGAKKRKVESNGEIVVADDDDDDIVVVD